MQGQKGDILIFKAHGDSALSRCIAALTNSSVSHAAIYYEDDAIVEMGSKGIMKSYVDFKETGDTAYFMRLKSAPDALPILKNTAKYLDQGVKYDYVSLLLLCGLILNQEMRATPRWEKITDYILKLGCKELDKLINHVINGKHPTMMCSQLAYQCYADSGKEYQIKLENPVVKNTAQATTLLEFSENLKAANPLPQVSYQQAKTVPLDNLAVELQSASTEEIPAELLASNNLDFEPSSQTQAIVTKFLDLANQYLEKIGSDLPVSALFVTPADLYEHSTNLEEVVEVKVARRK